MTQDQERKKEDLEQAKLLQLQLHKCGPMLQCTCHRQRSMHPPDIHPHF